MFFSLGLQRNTFNCKRSRLAKTVVEKHSTVVAKMNQSSSVDLENSCDHLFFHDHLQCHFADSTHGVLIAAAVFSFIACPFTCFLNVIFILAVKTKRSLQTHSNVCWHL